MTATMLCRIRLRFLALLPLAIGCTLFCMLHVRGVGATYDYPLTGFGDATITIDDLHVKPAGMARVLDVRQGDDGNYVATIEGLKPDNGFLLVTLPDQGGMSQLRVSEGPVVVADGANFSGWEVFPASVAVCFAATGILCLWALQEMRRHAWYGYEMASYAGAALFCLAQAGIFALLLASGRARSFVDFAEAESMRQYLLAQGVDDARILPETRSTNTRENFAFSVQVIAADGGAERPVAFATTNYHVFRGYVYAHDAGLDAEGIAAPTKLYFWPNAFLREFVGLLASRWLATLLSYLAVAAIYLAAEYALLLSFG